jgi:hypothetical protein
LESYFNNLHLDNDLPHESTDDDESEPDGSQDEGEANDGLASLWAYCAMIQGSWLDHASNNMGRSIVQDAVESASAWIAQGSFHSEEEYIARLLQIRAICDPIVLRPPADSEGDQNIPPWAPWFNPTELFLMLWVLAHGITKRAYLGIRRLMQASFSHYREKMHWPSWPVLMGRVREALPMLKLHVAEVSSGRRIVQFPYYVLADVIRRLLMYPGNFKMMVFEPRMGPTARELWNGDWWGGHPLFTYMSVTRSDDVSFSHGDSVYFTHDGERRMGRIMAVFRDELASGELGGLLCQITPYILGTDLDLEYDAAGAEELVFDWAIRVVVPVDNLLREFTVHARRDVPDGGAFCDTAVLRDPAGTQAVTIELAALPAHPTDAMQSTFDFAGYRQAEADHPDLKCLSLFIVFF